MRSNLWRTPMPFLTYNDQIRQQNANRRRLQAQIEADQEDATFWRKLWYAVRFIFCMLGGVGIGAFLFVVALTSIMPE